MAGQYTASAADDLDCSQIVAIGRSHPAWRRSDDRGGVHATPSRMDARRAQDDGVMFPTTGADVMSLHELLVPSSVLLVCLIGMSAAQAGAIALHFAAVAAREPGTAGGRERHPRAVRSGRLVRTPSPWYRAGSFSAEPERHALKLAGRPRQPDRRGVSDQSRPRQPLHTLTVLHIRPGCARVYCSLNRRPAGEPSSVPPSHFTGFVRTCALSTTPA